MADSQHLHGKTRFPANLARQLNSPVPTPVGQAKAKVMSFTRFFSKFIFLALFLIAIPLFPSQAPGFINQTILTKFWELFHLLFIGVAVSYGLFCRRNVDMDIETHTSNDDPQSYVSRVLHVSSIFGDGYDNSCGYGEKNAYQSWYCENNKSEFTSESSAISEQSKTGSLNCELGFQNPSMYGVNNVSQAWNSQYFPGESMVVVDQPNSAINEYGESAFIMNHKPLDLPVRRLRSGIRNERNPEISNGSDSSSILTDSSNSPSNHDRINEKFGDLNPLNLEDKFNATDALSSPISWRSRSVRTEIRGDVGISTHPSHFRPLSVDETQFESLKSQSFWSAESFSSQLSSMSDSPNRLSPSHSDSSELENLKMDDMEKEKSFRSSYPPMNGKTSLNALRIRRYSNGSLFNKNAKKSSGNGLKDRSDSKREDPLGYKEGRSASSKLDGNPANLVKASSRGKSVRTIRARGYAEQATRVEERSGNAIKDEVLKATNHKIYGAAGYKGKNDMKSGGFDNLSSDSRRQDLDNHYPMPKAKFSEFQKRNHKNSPEDFAVESSKEESESKIENFPLNSSEEADSNCVNDAAHDPNEVDKKAGEFIAKFREQIRLQKMASIDDRSRGINYFR